MTMEAAKEILRQLGGNKFIVMTGAKNLVGSDNTLSFRIGSGAKQRISGVHITLTPADLYDVEFVKIFKGARVVVEKVEGVYVDTLQDVFTRVTGMDTHL